MTPVTANVMLLSCVLAGAALGSEPGFRVEFGVDMAGPDEGRLIAETMSGDIIVAGYGTVREVDVASYVRPPERPPAIHSGGTPTYGRIGTLMLARFDSEGQLLWQRIFPELAEFRLLEMFSDDNGDFVVLARESVIEPRHYDDFEMRRISTEGDVSEILRRVTATCTRLQSGFVPETFALTEQRIHSFTFRGVTEPGLPSESPCTGAAAQIAMLTDGSVAVSPVAVERLPAGAYSKVQSLPSGQTVLLNEDYYLENVVSVSGATWSRRVIRKYVIAVAEADGSIPVSITVPGDAALGTKDIFATDRALFVFPVGLRDDSGRRVVRAYSLAGELMAETPVPVVRGLRLAAATPEGGMVAIGLPEKSSREQVLEFSPQGELILQAALHLAHSGGQVRDVQYLRDGRIALTGYSGPANIWWEIIHPPLKRDAYLLVAERRATSFPAD